MSKTSTSSTTSSSNSPFQFAVDETVYVFNGALLYQSKILKAELQNDTPMYFVHYQGWNKKWDDWVDASRIRKDTPETVTQAKEMLRATNEERKKDKNKKGKKKGTDESRVTGRKRKAVDDDETENGDKSDLKIKIPGPLKKLLIVDWENVTRNHTVVTLPRAPTVTKILDEFVQSKASSTNGEMTRELAAGLKQYFDRALGTVLLYRFERPQYQEQLSKNPDTPMSDIYGAEHLLRLFVKMPTLLKETKMDEKEQQVLQVKLTEFVKWLDKKQSYFQQTYESVNKEYLHQYEQVPA